MAAALEGWHRALQVRDAGALDALLADDAVFHSPVVHTQQAGKRRVAMYLGAAFRVFGNDSFRYVREVVSGNDGVLEFEVEIDGVHVNGVDMIRWNDAGRIVDFKVMLRPLRAIALVQERMAALLQPRA